MSDDRTEAYKDAAPSGRSFFRMVREAARAARDGGGRSVLERNSITVAGDSGSVHFRGPNLAATLCEGAGDGDLRMIVVQRGEPIVDRGISGRTCTEYGERSALYLSALLAERKRRRRAR